MTAATRSAVTESQTDLRVPDFFIVGAPKCGTTSLFRYLSEHPEVHVGAIKEPHFMSPEFQPAAWTDLERYCKNFAGAGAEQKIGEASVFYLYSETAAGNIQKYNPDARIIIMLRDPVEMIRSLHGEHHLSPLRDPIGSLEEALAAEADRKVGRRLPPELAIPPDWLFYREIGRYARQVERYLQVFGPERVQVIWFEDLKNRPEEVFAETCAFLGIDSSFRPVFRNHRPAHQYRFKALGYAMWKYSSHPGRWVRMLLPNPTIRRRISRALYGWNRKYTAREPMQANLETGLRNELAPDIRALARLLDRDLEHWISPRRSDAGD